MVLLSVPFGGGSHRGGDLLVLRSQRRGRGQPYRQGSTWRLQAKSDGKRPGETPVEPAIGVRASWFVRPQAFALSGSNKP